MKYAKRAVIVFLILAMVLVGLVIKTFYDAGEFREIKAHFNGQVDVIGGVLSSEDITIQHQSGIAFISSDDRRAHQPGSKTRARQGAIFGFDLSSSDPRLKDLTADFNKELNPHGISLWTAADGALSVFVVNHRQDGHFVEIFDYRDGKLIHRQSVSGSLMHSPNDVLAVGHNTFYVTNDHGSAMALWRMFEDYLQLARSYVLFYDGENFRKVAESLAYANGINMSPDGQTIYVAATVGQKIFVYDRDRTSGNLSQRTAIEAGTGVDNIEIDSRGNLWIGSHPKLLTFVKHSKDPAVLSPSQVIKVGKMADGQYEISEIYMSNGKPLSASSVAAVFQNFLLIGAVFEERFLLCTLAE